MFIVYKSGSNKLAEEASALRAALEMKAKHGPESQEFLEKDRELQEIRRRHRGDTA